VSDFALSSRLTCVSIALPTDDARISRPVEIGMVSQYVGTEKSKAIQCSPSTGNSEIEEFFTKRKGKAQPERSPGNMNMASRVTLLNESLGMSEPSLGQSRLRA